MIVHDPGLPEAAIRIDGLSRHFGAKAALDNMSLTVPRGSVFGLVGANGAGKTTLIRHILGLLRAEAGSVRVFGLDPVQDPVKVLARIGYLSEENDLPPWMRVGDLIRFMRPFYPNWDDAYAEELRATFALEPGTRFRDLSKGQKARVGLLVALAYRPELLVLDEPSSGLDPIVRRDILTAIVRTIADEGRTVLFSSHLLDEVERMSDRVALIDRGRVVCGGTLDQVKQDHRVITLHFDEPQHHAPQEVGLFGWEGQGREWSTVSVLQAEEFQETIRGWGARVVGERTPSLENVFMARVGRNAVSEEG